MNRNLNNVRQAIRPDGKFSAGAKRIAYLFLISALLLNTACKKDAEEPLLGISPTAGSIAFGSNAEENYRFEVDANRDWNAVSDQEWCKVTMDAEGGFFTVKAEPNHETTAPAPATITVTAGKAAPLTITATQAAARYEIYLAGSTHTYPACYWKNGQLIELQVPDNKHATSYSICVADDKVYIGGSHDYGKNSCYWVDGEFKFFSTGDGGMCNDIGIAGDRIIGLGFYSDKEYKKGYCCWFGFVSELHPIGPFQQSIGMALCIVGEKIHTVGTYIESGTMTAFYNDINFNTSVVRLKPLNGYDYSIAYDIDVYEDDIYIAGCCYNTEDKYIPGYWLNGEFRPLEDPATGVNGMAEGIAVENGTVHIAGSKKEGNHHYAFYWNEKQGRTQLPQPTGVFYEGMRRDIAVFGDKVFIMGNYAKNKIDTGCYWVDGERIDLADPNGGNCYATSMAVVKR